jgi:hypothetical protein
MTAYRARGMLFESEFSNSVSALLAMRDAASMVSCIAPSMNLLAGRL